MKWLAVCAMVLSLTSLHGQSLGNAGTIEGTVTDPTGAVIAGAKVAVQNRITGYKKSATTDAAGQFRFPNVPLNSYHLEADAPGFSAFQQDVSVRSSVTVTVKALLALAGSSTMVTVESGAADLIDNVPYAHNDMDHTLLMKLPTSSPGSGLSDAITLGTPGVVADSNGFFHPLGDHAQTSFSIDGQPVNDQQSKAFSTQLPPNAVQSMELITNTPAAEFGDKTSLVVSATTRSGLGQKKPTGSLVTQYGSFGTVGEEATLGLGSAKFGNFLSFNAIRSGRFLDTPEFRPVHAVGNNGTIFDRVDFQPTNKDSLHLNLFAARNWFQTPNTYDQPNQDQRQKVNSFNIAPGYQRTISPTTLLTVNAFAREDNVHYYSSRDPFDDTPATINQDRRLFNYGLKSDISHVSGHHNIKVGLQIMQTKLKESFSTGLTDPAFNAVCLDPSGAAQELPSITNPALCAGQGFVANPDLQAGLVPYDLTRGGTLFHFNDRGNVNQFAAFAQDSITYGGLTLSLGLRLDRYNGLSKDTSLQPRLGLSYHFKPTNTVFRAGYSRTMESPYNENLLLSSAVGSNGLGSGSLGSVTVRPLEPGHRNQFNVGLQQAVDKILLIDADYFIKMTDNAYDFDVLLNTPVTFPISWRKSKIDGVSVRVSTPDIHGFQAYTTMGHTRARFFGPENGGLIFNSPVDNAVFRIDHDQAFQQTTNLRYQRPHNGLWGGFTWRYDSGLVAGAVPDQQTALSLTGAQQAAI
ncbi:MAG: TonB-dependent receptor, partial [Bryobacteraceae bacterium]